MFGAVTRAIVVGLVGIALISCSTTAGQKAKDNPKAVLGSVIGAAAGAGLAATVLVKSGS